jgi:hypothetical protein
MHASERDEPPVIFDREEKARARAVWGIRQVHDPDPLRRSVVGHFE